MSILECTSRVELLEALKKCILTHKEIFERGILHCDISTGNLMCNGMLIDFEQAVFLTPAHGDVRGRGTRPFKGIDVHLGKPNSFMNDVESFFWVLFWICIYREGSSINNRIVPDFDEWWYLDEADVAARKKGVVRNEADFLRIAEENFNAYHQPLSPWVSKLRQIVFPDGVPRTELDKSISDNMVEILEDAQSDELVRRE